MRRIAALLVAALALAACGDDDTDTAETGAGPTTTTTEAPTSTTTGPASTPTSAGADLQPALWPAPDVVFATPEEAATDFIEGAFPGSAVTFSEFRQGDSRSGEIEVFRPREGGGQGPTASTLSLRQLGAENGWFVLAASNPTITIESVEAGDEVPAGPLLVNGVGRGFEATLNVLARPAGALGADDLDLALAMGGAQEESLAYEATLDLTGATPGTVMLLVRGDTGLEGDTGEFTAIPIVVG